MAPSRRSQYNWRPSATASGLSTRSAQQVDSRAAGRALIRPVAVDVCLAFALADVCGSRRSALHHFGLHQASRRPAGSRLRWSRAARLFIDHLLLLLIRTIDSSRAAGWSAGRQQADAIDRLRPAYRRRARALFLLRAKKCCTKPAITEERIRRPPTRSCFAGGQNFGTEVRTKRAGCHRLTLFSSKEQPLPDSLSVRPSVCSPASVFSN